MQPLPTKFNVRVYGIVIQDDFVIISEEFNRAKRITKFPGGGLELGEGIVDGLKREFMEELGVEIEVGECFYVNPDLQISGIIEHTQLITLYYLVKMHGSPREGWLSIDPFPSFPATGYGNIGVHKVHISQLTPDCATFPTDQNVIAKLRADYGLDV